MRVNQSRNPSVKNLDSSSTQKAEETSSDRGTQRSKEARVRKGEGSASSSISGKAKEYVKAKEVATQAPDERAAKIEELKRRIANKEYNVKPEAIADKLVDEHLSTLGIG